MVEIEAVLAIEFQCSNCHEVHTLDYKFNKKDSRELKCMSCGRTTIYNVQARLTRILIDLY